MPESIDPGNKNRFFASEKSSYSTEIVNYSGYEEWEIQEKGVRQWLAPIPAERFVLFPDISPTEPGIVPTGVLAEINMETHPDWRRYIRGADIGCGMLGADLSILRTDFSSEQQSLDELYVLLKKEGLDVCFGGNHFINFAAGADDHVFVLIHTGSYGDRQKILGNLVEQPAKYDAEYVRTIDSGVETRKKIMDQIARVYGKPSNQFDTVHNTISIDPKTGLAHIYKGVVHVQREGELQILPSSLSGKMIRYQAGAGAQFVTGTSHGTGRMVSRGKMNLEKEILAELYEERIQDGRIEGQKLGIMVPIGMRWPMTEIEEAYHPIDRSVRLLTEYELALPGSIEYLQPIAGIKGE